MNTEEKAKAYDEALKRAGEWHNDPHITIGIKGNLEDIFPELRGGKEERTMNCIGMCLTDANEQRFKDYGTTLKDCLAWLKKQGEKSVNKLQVSGKLYEHIRNTCACIDDALSSETLADINDYLSMAERSAQSAFDMIEKQGEQEQLYIRFGEIPTDEKSKIFQGEIEVGTENGVSAYPAFKTSEGDIVLGLSLPITKTTLYTQQHLIEYDDRPCYLVKGDYVGKDTDGQPLINNVSIIEKIDTYRVKEEKQDEQKPTDEIEPKFHEGEWVVISTSGGEKVVQIDSIEHFKSGEPMYITSEGRWFGNGTKAHLWTIQDAKDGDVLASKDKLSILIFKNLDTSTSFSSYYNIAGQGELGWSNDCFVPATKEQRDALFAKMTEAGYEWDTEKKELKKIEDEEYNGEDYGIDSLYHAQRILEKTLGSVDGYQTDDGILSHKCAITAVKKLYEQKPVWSEEDEDYYDAIIAKLEVTQDDAALTDNQMEFLKSLKQRIGWKPSDEQMGALLFVVQHYTPNVTDKLAWDSIKILELMYHDLKKLTE